MQIPDPMDPASFPQASKRLLRAGLSYYRRGNVRKLKIDEHGNYDAIVRGKRNHLLYHTRIMADSEEFQAVCDCPTPQQPCKHVLAVLFAIHDLNRHGRYQRSRWHPIFYFINLLRKMRLPASKN